MEGAKFLFILGISVLCFGVYTTEASKNITKIMKGASSKVTKLEVYKTGASLKSFYDDPQITVSSYGGPGGNGEPYSFLYVKEITVSVSQYALECLKFIDENGKSLTIGCGSSGRDLTNTTIVLDLPNEYFTGFSGEIGDLFGDTVVKSITFYTNDIQYGPYGTEGDTPFSFQQTGGIVTGFHGKAGWLVDSIGVYVKAVCLPPPKLSKVKSS